jgi:hypothetical protein
MHSVHRAGRSVEPKVIEVVLAMEPKAVEEGLACSDVMSRSRNDGKALKQRHRQCTPCASSESAESARERRQEAQSKRKRYTNSSIR